MSIKIFVEKNSYGRFRLSAKIINKTKITEDKWVNILDSIPNYQTAIAEARKFANSWYGHTDAKESVIDLYVKYATEKQNGHFLFQSGKFYRVD